MKQVETNYRDYWWLKYSKSHSPGKNKSLSRTNIVISGLVWAAIHPVSKMALILLLLFFFSSLMGDWPNWRNVRHCKASWHCVCFIQSKLYLIWLHPQPSLNQQNTSIFPSDQCFSFRKNSKYTFKYCFSSNTYYSIGRNPLYFKYNPLYSRN